MKTADVWKISRGVRAFRRPTLTTLLLRDGTSRLHRIVSSLSLNVVAGTVYFMSVNVKLLYDQGTVTNAARRALLLLNVITLVLDIVPNGSRPEGLDNPSSFIAINES